MSFYGVATELLIQQDDSWRKSRRGIERSFVTEPAKSKLTWLRGSRLYPAQIKDNTSLSPGSIGNKAKTVDKGVYYVYKGQLLKSP